MKKFIIIIIIVCAALIACTSPGSGTQSPGQPTSAGAGLGQGAQTIGGSQGAGQTPQSTPGGQASQNWHFASLMPFETLTALLEAARDGAWTAETLLAAIQAASGAPHTVAITVANMTIQGGSASATGATAGVGGGTAGSGSGPVNNE